MTQGPRAWSRILNAALPLLLGGLGGLGGLAVPGQAEAACNAQAICQYPINGIQIKVPGPNQQESENAGWYQSNNYLTSAFALGTDFDFREYGRRALQDLRSLGTNTLRKSGPGRAALAALSSSEWEKKQAVWACKTGNQLSPGTEIGHSWQVSMGRLMTEFTERAAHVAPRVLTSSGIMSILFIISTIALMVKSFQSGILESGSLESIVKPVARILGAAILVSVLTTPPAIQFIAGLAGNVIAIGGEAHYRLSQAIGIPREITCSGGGRSWGSVRDYAVQIFHSAGNIGALGVNISILQFPNVTDIFSQAVKTLSNPTETFGKIMLFVTSISILVTSAMAAITISIRAAEQLVVAAMYLAMTPITLWLITFKSTQRTAAMPAMICAQVALSLMMLGIGTDLALQIMMTGVDFYASTQWGDLWGYAGGSASRMFDAMLEQHVSVKPDDTQKLSTTMAGVFAMIVSCLMAKAIVNLCCQIAGALVQVANLDSGGQGTMGAMQGFFGKK